MIVVTPSWTMYLVWVSSSGSPSFHESGTLFSSKENIGQVDNCQGFLFLHGLREAEEEYFSS